MKPAVIHLVMAGMLVLSAAASALAQDVAVVVNRSNPTDSISMSELRKILLTEETQWPAGKKAIVVLMTKTERAGTLKAVAGMNENDFTVHLMHLTFNGETADPPKVLGSGALVKQAVAGTPGGIGFINSGEADDSVKVLKINGLAPGQSGYGVTPK